MANDRKKVEADINVKAWKDPQFRTKLLENPRSALEEIGMKHVPASMQVSVVEEDERTWCIVLRNQTPRTKRTTEKELKELMAGQEEEPGCSAAGR